MMARVASNGKPATVTQATGRKGTRPQSSPRRRPKVETKLQLLQLAGELIGEHGYAGCSIARLTSRANIAHGAFYLHFKSQQQIFDQVLPTLGALMLHEIGDAIRDCKDAIAIEKAGFAANFNYLYRHPYMYRVMAEAQLYAPEAFRNHQDAMADRYAKSLQRSLTGKIKDSYDFEDMKATATMLIGARIHILLMYGVQDGIVHPLPKRIVASYIAFATASLAPYYSDVG